MTGLGGRMAMLAACLALAGCELAAVGGVVGAVTAASRPSAVPVPPAAPEPAPAPPAEATPASDATPPAAEPADEPADSLAGGPVAATLAGLRVLDGAGRAALSRAEGLLAGEPGTIDRCALQVLEALSAHGGAAEAARWAVWLAGHARQHAAEVAIPGMVGIGDRALVEIREGARAAQLDPAPLIGFEDASRLAEALGAAREPVAACRGEAARPFADLLEAAQTPAD